MTAKTMAEVLAEHPSLFGAYEWNCAGCREPIGGLKDGSGPKLLAAHQAAALSAAGFGLVADAQREAWDEGWEHYGKHFSPNFSEFGVNPYRAAPAEELLRQPEQTAMLTFTRDCTLCGGDIHVVNGESQRHTCRLPR